jgi:hypothetical protein
VATEGFVQLASDGTGKEVRTVIVTGAGPGEHQQVVSLADSNGNLDPTLKVDLSATAANATAIKVDGSAVTQPVSGTVTVQQATGTNLHTVADSGALTANQGTANATPWIRGSHICGRSI